MERDDPLWQLLGKAPRPQAEGWFVARTLAACRRTKPEMVLLGGRFLNWVMGFSGATVVAMGLYMTTLTLEWKNTTNLHETFNYISENHPDVDEDLWIDETG